MANSIIDFLVKHTYLYNFSWEDSSVDNHFLNINSSDTMLCITTGGDNILNYLIHEPKKIVTVDFNNHQNDLLKLKIALIKVCSQKEYMKIIGKNNYSLFCKKFIEIKKQKLLEKNTELFWEENKDIMKNFIYSGSSGYLAKILTNLFKVYIKDFTELKYMKNLEQQIEWYNKNKTNIHNFLRLCDKFKYLFSQLQGVPVSQLNKHEDIYFKLSEITRNILTKSLFNKNYFYYPYLFNEMTDDCCLPYMSKENYYTVKSKLNHIEIHTTLLNDFLMKNKKYKFTKISLLDHMDWLSTKEIAEEFRFLQKNVDKNHKIIFRSFGCINNLDPSLTHLNYLYRGQINIENGIPIDKVHMYSTICCITIPPNLVIKEIPNIVVDINLINDMKTLYNMFMKPIHGSNQLDRLESFYKDQSGNYDSYRHRFLHGKYHLMKAFPLLKNKTVLDIGGATGFNFEYIKNDLHIFKKITILDLCPSLLKVADERIKKNNWKNCVTKHQDIMTFTNDKKYDIIMISYTLTMVPDWKKIVDKIYQLLEPDGYFLITDFTLDKYNKLECLFWKNVFKTDNVFLDEKHLEYIRDTFSQEIYYKDDYGDFPYMPPNLKCKWYCGIYRK